MPARSDGRVRPNLADARLVIRRALRAAAVVAAMALPAGPVRAQAGPTSPTRIYAGMWTNHVLRPAEGLDANSLLAVSHRGYFAGTFVNSYGGRSVSAGIQRVFTRPRSGAVRTSLGYRVGLITGYDDRLFRGAGKWPALPFAQLLGNVDCRNVGLEVGYAGLVTSVAANWRF
jgi:hypothetical protein